MREAWFELADGTRAPVPPAPGYRIAATLVLRLERHWAARCSHCLAICRDTHESKKKARRWHDLTWGEHRVELEASLVRVKCANCGSTPTELVPWADAYQRQTRRLQQRIALMSASMPIQHVAALSGLSWCVVRRAELRALARWDATRPKDVPLTMVGVDEKWLGRKHKRTEKYVTIVSNLETSEPIWVGYGRDSGVLEQWLATLTVEQKQKIRLFVMDMHAPYKAAVRSDGILAKTPIVHDPFHVIKRANEAVNEIRKDVFFRAGPEMRALGRGTRWLVQRSWEKSNPVQRESLVAVLSLNRLLYRSYQLVEELREALKAPTREDMRNALGHIYRCTQLRRYVHLRKWHDSLRRHEAELLTLAEHRPPTGRVEALNNAWETLVRVARGYRRLDHLFLKLKFIAANPIRTPADTQRFLALALTPPMRRTA